MYVIGYGTAVVAQCFISSMNDLSRKTKYKKKIFVIGFSEINTKACLSVCLNLLADQISTFVQICNHSTKIVI